MSWLSAVLASTIGGLLVLWIWSKYQNWNDVQEKDRAAIRIMEVALNLLPDKEREYYHEEWFMFLCDQESATDRLKHALNFFGAAAVIGGTARVPLPARQSLASVGTKIGKLRKLEKPKIISRVEKIGGRKAFTFRINNSKYTHLTQLSGSFSARLL